MAASKKYAGLPDLDDAGTELYQTPGLTDDASTVQTSTIRTESPAPSDDAANENLDRTRFDREQARQRFEPAVVNADDVNFSYAVGGAQKSYTLRNRRRRTRRRRRSDGVKEFGDLSDDSAFGEEESLGQRLARLKREAEEIKLELERRETAEDEEFKDSYEDQQGGTDNEGNETDLMNGVNDLSRVLNRLQVPGKPRHETVEQAFTRRMNAEESISKQQAQSKTDTSKDAPTRSTIDAIATFSDRLSAIESALGLSTLPPISNPTAILPTLETLSSQVNLLHSTLTPRQTPTSTSTNLTPQMPHLDILQSRLHTLHQSATSVLNARKSAQTALGDLETVRVRGIRTGEHLARYQNIANRRHNRPISTSHALSDNDNDGDNETTNPKDRSTSHGGGGAAAAAAAAAGNKRRSTAAEEARERIEIADEIVTPLFLEDQAEKIKALYNVLPTIQNLQPLLPVVLERLRGLSVVHAGAASARSDMDELESRLRQWEVELGKWKGAVEGVEDGIQEAKGVMRENVAHVGGLVSGVEERVGRLEGRDRK